MNGRVKQRGMVWKAWREVGDAGHWLAFLLISWREQEAGWEAFWDESE